MPKLGETITIDFSTASPTTGATTAADSTPAIYVFEDASDTAILSPTPVARTGYTGVYRVQVACTAGNGFEAAKSYNVLAVATVGGVTARAPLASFQVRSSVVDDLSIPTASANASAVRTELATELGRIDVASSTLATASALSSVASGVTTSGNILASGTYGNAALKTLIDAIGTVTTAIKAVTDNLPNSGALSDLATLATRLSSARAGYLDSLNGMVAQSGDSYSRLGAPAGASIAADIAAVEATIPAADIRAALGMAAADMDNQLDAILSAAGGSSGGGSVTYVATIRTTGGTAISDADVWISSDSGGNSVVAGVLRTNGSGQATFYLDPGSYYLWVQKHGYNVSNPQSITVS